MFFGKARCAVCHSGPLFSDFKFHSVGVDNFGPGINNSGDDQGRYLITKDVRDRYTFRTPPLRNVTLSAPYFHNGSASTLHEVINQHLDPLNHADQYEETGEFAMSLDQIEAVSPILVTRIMLTIDEIESLIAFLQALEDRGLANMDRVIPSSVPSGLPVSALPTNSAGTR